MTLYTALVTMSKVAAPMIPFMTEEIYQNLVCSVDKDAKESIHLCDYPVANEAFIDEELEQNMERVLEAVVMGRACRNQANVKNRQPIGTMFVKAEYTLSDFYKEIIEDELNVKDVKFVDDVREFTTYEFKPQLRTVGPKYGKQLGGIKQYLSSIDGNAAMDTLKADGKLAFDVNGVNVELAEEDLLIEMTKKEGYMSEADNGVTVVLDMNLTDELIEEGNVSEIISKIQTMRKDAGFEVMDHITVYVSGNDTVADVVKKNEAAISEKVLADTVTYAEMEGVTLDETPAYKEWNINGEKVVIGVEKNA
jgi:isoleucyl-tRNA synthetase